MTSVAIKTVTNAGAEQAIAVVVMAFSTDPLIRWAFPGAHQYLTHYPSYVRALTVNAFEHQTVHYADNFSGASFWLPPGISFDQGTVVDVLLRAASAHIHSEIFALLEKIGSYHPDEPHWYLPLMGVEPTQQGRGIGSALLKHALSQCDQDGKLAYLEASSPANKALYERHGFESLDMVQIGSSPPLFPMLRQPR